MKQGQIQNLIDLIMLYKEEKKGKVLKRQTTSHWTKKNLKN